MNQYKHVHFIGIGGIGMSALAHILLSRKISVSGSDLQASSQTEKLKEKGAKISIGHLPEQIPTGATVVYSSSISTTNPELQSAKKQACAVLHRSEFLAELMKEKTSLAVTGTHGKTTVSALLSWVLSFAKTHSSFAVGGVIPQMGCHAGWDSGKFMVVEADESDGTFTKYHPYGAIVTNIDTDHLDHYGDSKAIENAFRTFLTQVESEDHLFIWGEDPILSKWEGKGIRYGFDPSCPLQAFKVTQDGWESKFTASFEGKTYKNLKISLPGKHNVLNALAVFGMALKLGLAEKVIRSAFENFHGIKRRSERKGEFRGVLFLDDYAHHPTEISATLKGVKEAIADRKLIALIQPHRYSRTRDCLGQFGSAVSAAEHVIITDIYSAGEDPIEGITPQKVVDEILKSGKSCSYLPREGIAKKITLRPHDVLITLGAGDVTMISEEIKKESIEKLSMGVIVGGQSSEHLISLVSADQILSEIDQEAYDVTLFGIDRKGQWRHGPQTLHDLKCEFSAATKTQSTKIPSETLEELQKCDVVLPILHGTFGEDGTVQGMLEMLGIPYAGCSFRASAVAMDKTLSKTIVNSAGVSTAESLEIHHEGWQNQGILLQVEEKFSYPFYVKPVHLGSSIAVKKVSNQEELLGALQKIFTLDTKALVEEEVKGRELEFPVVGGRTPTIYPPSEVFSSQGAYDYQAKYFKPSIDLEPCAKLSDELIEKGKEEAFKVWKAIDGYGMARIDFFLKEDGTYVFNEINPIPGFTPNSLYPLGLKAHGLTISQWVDQQVKLALRRHQA